MRKLAKGHKTKTKREARLVLAWKDGAVTERITDLDFAPHNHPEVTGERMFVAAIEAGMGDNTHIHGVFDMGSWIRTQFEEQFSALKRSICADLFHTKEYLGAAASAFEKSEEGQHKWLSLQGDRLKLGLLAKVVAELKTHHCGPGKCPKMVKVKEKQKEECAVVAAKRYLTKYESYMRYDVFIAQNLPIGSGLAEGGIRHLVRKRLDIPGDWREENVSLLMAIISIRESGWWNDFWAWRERRDRERFRQRRQGMLLNQFRGCSRHDLHRLQEAA